MQIKKKRPVFINLLRIKFPPTAIASIMHRIAGVLLIVSLPFLIYLFNLSLQNQASFASAKMLTDHPLVSIYLYLLLWAISHHFLAGIRYFLIDLEIISGKCAAAGSASIVTAAGVLIPVIVFSWGFI